jgi:hypothetical protein
MEMNYDDKLAVLGSTGEECIYKNGLYLLLK